MKGNKTDLWNIFFLAVATFVFVVLVGIQIHSCDDGCESIDVAPIGSSR